MIHPIDQLRIAIKIDAGQSAAGRGADRKADDSLRRGLQRPPQREP